jgi:hypothetical protein
VPWVPALVLFVLPAAMLASVAPAIAAGLAVLLPVAAIIYAKRDPVSGARRAAEAPGSSAASPLPKIEVPAGAGDLDLDFASTAEQSGGPIGRIRSIVESARGAARSVGQSGRRGVRFVVQLVLLNLLPFVEYCALVSGILVVWMGWQAAAERDMALGVGLVSGALLVGGLASIVTRRMSYRFFLDPRVGHAGVAAIIAGVMQLIAGGLAAAAAHALAMQTWQARLDALAVNPWPLLIPVALLLICAGLLMLRPSSDRIGPLGTMLYVVPKTLVAIAALVAGIAILGGGGWRLLFALDPWGRLHGDIAAEPFERRFNARWGNLAVNLVGTGVLDCSKATDPDTCYTQPFVRYQLSHRGVPWITDAEQSWTILPVPIGSIDGAKALAAEQWLDPIVNAWSKPFVASVARSELSVRPLGGSYEIELDLGPEVVLERIQRVQLLVSTSYWVSQGQ